MGPMGRGLEQNSFTCKIPFLEMAKKVFTGKKKLLSGKLHVKLKNRIMMCLVSSAALYRTMAWILVQATDED